MNDSERLQVVFCLNFRQCEQNMKADHMMRHGICLRLGAGMKVIKYYCDMLHLTLLSTVHISTDNPGFFFVYPVDN